MLYLSDINNLIDDGLISKTKHPDYSIWVYNYTNKCQYEQSWTPETLQCRGLILDEDGNVVARPFPKFFNIGEHLAKGNSIPTSKPEITEKYDGSLIIGFRYGNEFCVATRGSFQSEQAKKAKEILEMRYAAFVSFNEYTYLFEVIYPENRIVVDYKDREDLILLGIIHRVTGEEVPHCELNSFGWEGPIVELHSPDIEWQKISSKNVENKEGVVLKFFTSTALAPLRLKAKYSNYVRLHKILTATTERTIWAHLKDELPIEDFLDRVPDEFFQWVKKVKRNLQVKFLILILEAVKEHFRINEEEKPKTRKEYAFHACKWKYPHMLFGQYDNKKIDHMVWLAIKPKSTKAFKCDE